ncbi:MAG: HAMP domain-containing protein, partial [Acidobacteriaceae bacterium]
MRQRVFFKLLAAMVLVLLVAAGMLDISQQNILEHSLENRLAHGLKDKAQSLAARVAVADPAGFAALVQEEARAADARVTIVRRDGNFFRDSGGGAFDAAAMLGSAETRAITVQHHNSGQHIARGVLSVTAPAGEYIVRLSSPLADIHDTLHTVRTSLLWATLLALLLATLISALLAHVVARRLARIVEFAHRLAAGDFSARIHDTARDEIAAVANALDATTIRVESVFRELEDSRKEMETVLDSMEEAVIAVDAQSRIHWTNRVMVRLVGAPIQPGSALVQTVRDPDLLTCVEQALRLRVAGSARAQAVVPGRIFEVSAAPMPGGSAVV